jgi:hypothetical protein
MHEDVPRWKIQLHKNGIGPIRFRKPMIKTVGRAVNPLLAKSKVRVWRIRDDERVPTRKPADRGPVDASPVITGGAI